MARSNIRMQKVGSDLEASDSGGGLDYAGLSWVDLRRVASERGVVSWRRKREQIEGDLLALDKAGQGGA